MSYAKIQDGALVEYPYTVEQFRAANPNTSYPANMPDDVLEGYGIYAVTESDKPTYNERTQKISLSNTPALTDGSWKLNWSVTDKNETEIAEYDADQSAQKRNERNARLSICDWTQVADAGVDKAAWATYRQALRDVPAQDGFPYTITWPTEPGA